MATSASRSPSISFTAPTPTSPPSARSASGSAELGAPTAARLTLASASPRRREILTTLGIEFEAVVPEVAELTTGEPAEVVLANARRKARAGWELAGARRPALGVDTDVALGGALLGKPGDEREARARLEALSGRTHEVLSGVVLFDPSSSEPDAEERSAVARTVVAFRELDPATVELYVRSREWIDRAGGYAIQGLGSILVERLEGDFSNVVGLPIATLLELAPELFE